MIFFADGIVKRNPYSSAFPNIIPCLRVVLGKDNTQDVSTLSRSSNAPFSGNTINSEQNCEVKIYATCLKYFKT